jgi:hypothetical protein
MHGNDSFESISQAIIIEMHSSHRNRILENKILLSLQEHQHCQINHVVTPISELDQGDQKEEIESRGRKRLMDL